MTESMPQGAVVRNNFLKGVENAHAGKMAARKAEKTAELRLTNLPRFSSMEELSTAVNDALGDLVHELEGPDSASTEYVQRVVLFRNGRTAVVLVTPTRIGRMASERGKLQVMGYEVTVLSMNRGGFSGLRKSRQELWSFEFPLLRVEFGEMEGRSFKVFWASRNGNDHERGAQVVQVQMISKVLGFNLAGLYNVRLGSPRTGTFRRSKARVRLEIPFQAIIEAASFQKNCSDEAAHAVYFPLRFSASIFRAVGTAGNIVWSRGTGLNMETRYARSLDWTANNAFSRARAVRIFLDTRDDAFTEFTNRLRQARVADSNPPLTPRTVRGVFDSSCPRVSAAFIEARTRYSVPFSVRFEVDFLVTMGAVSGKVLEYSSFWERLSPLSTAEALKVMDRLHVAALSISDYRIDVSQALDDALRIVSSSDYSLTTDKSEGYSISNEDSAIPSTDENVRSTSVSVVPTSNKHMIDPAVTAATAAILRDAENGSVMDEDNDSIDTNFVPIRRLLITPTKVIPCKAEMDMLNRVLRQFRQHRERFLRVTFADEDGGRVSFLDSAEDLYARVRYCLTTGVYVAGEKFVFLAFSSSQLREHGCWFYNEPNSDSTGPNAPPSADLIRSGFGDLSNIRVPSRYAARMGQAFSSTVGTLTLTDADFTVLDDVTCPDPKNPRKQYVFSDGVGFMDSRMANQVRDELKLSSTCSPSAYQIRFAGAKGVLSVWNNVQGGRMILRRSMCKFNSSHRTLEIVGYSKRLPFFLNRQFVTLLEGLGVKSSIFVDMQNRFLNELDVIMEPGETQASLNFLYATGSGRGPQNEQQNRLRFVGPMSNAVSLFKAGLTCQNSEFLYNLMSAFRQKLLLGVKNRARIPIAKACNLIGILDELGVLKENQIFAQVTHAETGNLTLVEGKCIVGRSPALHPGDLQLVDAVDHPSLGHLIDVVVFPQVGKRPLPSKLSGGDLDGDIFSVIWDARLTCVEAREDPMDYTAEKEKPLSRPVNMEDVKDFMIKFMMNDNLGRIASAFLAYADKEGIHSNNAKHLARLHSRACDFAKTGIPAQFPRRLALHNTENTFPDFLQRSKRVSYKSKKALGMMYRHCVARVKDRGSSNFDQSGTVLVDRVFNQFEYGADLGNEAHLLCTSWNLQVRTLMEQFGVETEAEIVTGHVTRFTNQSNLVKDSKSYRSKLNVLNIYMRDLKTAFRKKFFAGIEVAEDDENDPRRSRLSDATCKKMQSKMASWYFASKQIANADKQKDTTPILSFPFVVTDIFVRIVESHLIDDASNSSSRGNDEAHAAKASISSPRSIVSMSRGRIYAGSSSRRDSATRYSDSSSE